MGDSPRGLADYANVPSGIAVIVSNRMATLAELDTVYSTEDLYDMLEIIAVDAYNQRVLTERER